MIFYFISATQDWDRWTYVGKVPERITFNLKPGANYIALPLDTSLKKAVDICNSLGLDNSSAVGVWDPITQNYLNEDPSSCGYIRRNPGAGGPLNFNLSAGAMYYVGGLTEDKEWLQI